MNKIDKKIVLVEDDEMIRQAYSDVLMRAGYEVITAKDGKEGLLAIKNAKPDLVLLDIILPIIDGFEVLTEVKKDQELKDIPVLILSNLGQDCDIEKGIELGAIAYMIKANNNSYEVLEKVKQFIR